MTEFGLGNRIYGEKKGVDGVLDIPIDYPLLEGRLRARKQMSIDYIKSVIEDDNLSSHNS